MLTCALAGVAGAGSAQTLDLAGAYAAALSQDAALRASRAANEAAREAVPQAEASLRPALSAQLARSRNSLDNGGASGQPAPDSSAYSARSATVSLRQPLYRPALLQGLRQAQAQAAEGEAKFEKDTQDLALRVAEAYFELLLADDQIALVQAQKAAYTAQLDAAVQALAAGSGTRTDIDEVQARLDMSVAQALQAAQHREFAGKRLRAMVTEPFDTVAPLDVAALKLTPPEPNVLQAWIDRAERHSPELGALKAQLEAAQAQVAKRGADHLPSLDAVAEWSRNDSDNVNRIGSRYGTRLIGLQLSIPLYAGGGTQSAVRQAVAERARVADSLEALRRDLHVRIYKEFAGVSEGVLRIRALEQAVRSAEQALVSNRHSYAGGVRTALDVLDAEQRRASALNDLAQARYQYLLSRLRLEVLAGTFDAARMQAINAFFTAGPARPAPADSRSQAAPAA